MAVYRFLFAPVLLAVAVLIASRERAARSVPPVAPAAEARAPAAGTAGVLPTQPPSAAATASVR